jgi:hypothetical protein
MEVHQASLCCRCCNSSERANSFDLFASSYYFFVHIFSISGSLSTRITSKILSTSEETRAVGCSFHSSHRRSQKVVHYFCDSFMVLWKGKYSEILARCILQHYDVLFQILKLD